MKCTFCQQIEADLAQLENDYAAKMELLRAKLSTASTEDYRNLQALARSAKQDLDFARTEMNAHIWTHHRHTKSQSGAT